MEKLKLDRHTFETIYNQNWEKLFGICYYHIQDNDLANEIVQDIFCSLWERRNSLEIQGPIENYLTRSAKYKVIDYFRSKASQQQIISVNEIELCDKHICTENQVLYHSLTERLGILVDTLPCQCQQVYRLSRERGFNTKEIASQLLISEKTAKNHLNKALNFLRLHLREYR